MTDIQFYHLLSTPLERALPKLLEKACASGMRAVVCAADEARVEALNSLLWTYNPGNFLAHGSAKDGHAEDQPIFLTERDENPNGAQLLVITDGRKAVLEGVAKVLDIFDGTDEAATANARQRWKEYKEAGHSLTYIKQTPQGGWEKVA